MCLAFPDVCLTPAPPAPAPVPIPYPNIGLEPTNVGFVPNVLI
ncbi:MAG: PAAR-like domain-containing protein, partial [Myxococcales bacterium]